MLKVKGIESRLRLEQRLQPNLIIDGTRRLLGLPTIHDDEVFSSWLTRMILSGKINKRQLLQELSLKSQFYLADLTPERLNLQQLVLRFNLVQTRVLEKGFIKFNPKARFSDTICLTTDVFNRKPIYRFCPSCISEEPYIRKSWRYAFSYACSKHKCLLLERCLNCGNSINLENLNIASFNRLGIKDLSQCLCCNANLSAQKPNALPESTIQKVLAAQGIVIAELSNGCDINKYIAQVGYLEKGFSNYLNVGISGTLMFKNHSNEIRSAFEKANLFKTTHWQPLGRIHLNSSVGKIKRTQQWILKQLN